MTIFRTLGRALARFNRWFAGAAAADAVVHAEGSEGTSIDAMGVKAIMGEIERETRE
jgi:hypothetical protein